MSKQCRGVTYVRGAAVPCEYERGKCIWHDEDGKCPPEDSWGRRLPYDDATKRTLAAQQRRSRGYDGGVEDERAAVVAWLREQARAQGASPDERTILTWASNRVDRGEHRREEER